MKKIRLIGWLVLVGMLTGCSTVTTPPADDAYYWEKPWHNGSSSSASAAEPSASNAVEPDETSSKPVIEYTNVSDTVVTVRIRR